MMKKLIIAILLIIIIGMWVIFIYSDFERVKACESFDGDKFNNEKCFNEDMPKFPLG